MRPFNEALYLTILIISSGLCGLVSLYKFLNKDNDFWSYLIVAIISFILMEVGVYMWVSYN